MSWLSNLFSGTIGGIVREVGNTVDKFVTTDEEKMQFKIKLEELLQKRDLELEQSLRKELEAKERVVVAELQQGDNYTKRARPTVVYMGLFFIFINYCLVPLVSKFAGLGIEPLDLPAGFWAGWSGIVGTWSIGRSLEKKGMGGKIVSAITGSQQRKSLFFDDGAKG